MNGQSPGGTADAEQSTPNPAEEIPTGEEPSNSEAVREQKTDQHPAGEEADDKNLGDSRLGEILGGMTDLPTEVREKEAKGQPKAESGKRKPDSKAKGKVEGQPKPGAKPGEQEQEQDEPVDDRWPDSAKQRVAAEAEKRRTRTTERDAFKTRAEKAEARAAELEKKSAPIIAPTQADPLADITDEQNLVACAQDYQRLQQWAKRNRNGLENVLIGKDAEGKEVRHDYTPEEMAEIEIDCDRILNQAVPMRAAYIHDNRIFEAEARKVHPEIFDEKSEIGKEAALILQQLPEIKRFTDWQLWLGDAIKARNARMTEAQKAAEAAKNGNGAGKPSPTVEALRKPQPQRVSSVPTARSTAPSAEHGRGDDVEVETAEKNMIESGGDEIDIEKFVGATLGGGQARGAREPVSV